MATITALTLKDLRESAEFIVKIQGHPLNEKQRKILANKAKLIKP